MGSRPGLASDVSMNTILSPALQAKYMDPGTIRDLLMNAKTIAMVGLSPKKQRPSNFVASYLQYEGYRVIPVNPRATEILGEKAYPDLISIPAPVDIVDVFRAPSECPVIAQQAVEIGATGLWLQLRIVSTEAAEIAEAGGLTVIMDRCMKMEHGRYNGSLHWVGMNTEIITARKAQSFI